jgi:acetyl-CoA C-acetyltransferase
MWLNAPLYSHLTGIPEMSQQEVYIVSGARTPMGGLQGSLSAASAPELGSAAIAASIEKAGIEAADIDEVFMGCVLPAGLKQAPARQAAIGAGIPTSTGAVTVNKMCASAMQATIFAHDSIVAGTNEIVISGGMESMSNAPHLVLGSRAGLRTGANQLPDHMFIDGLEDAYTGRAMGSFAQETADQYGISRKEMDDFAINSLTRAKAAMEAGKLDEEITPVTITTRRGETVVSEDEQPLKANLEKIPSLRPAFAKDGTITAANASSISDGASALLLMSADAVAAKGVTPMAKIVAHARHSQNPEEFTIAPIGAINKVLEKCGWNKDDVDLFEINEAFAMVTMLAIRECGLDYDKVNIHGGACAQGHPVGSTGSRIVVSLMHQLKQRGEKRGIAALCIGGGEATAIAIEMV